MRAVANAIRRSRAGLSDPHRPIGSFLPRPHRRGQDRAGPGAGRLPVRRRAGHGPHRHERVHGEARGGPAHRRPARLHRLRRGRSAHRGGGGGPTAWPARRDRKGPPRRLQRAAAGDGRRPPDRRPGSHGRLHQRRAHHDVEPARRSAGVLQARVRQPGRRDDPVPAAHRGRPRPHRRHPARDLLQQRMAARRIGLDVTDAAKALVRPGRATTPLRGPAAQAGHPAGDRRPGGGGHPRWARWARATPWWSTPPATSSR